MIENKDIFPVNSIAYNILISLENALKNNDEFAAFALLNRLEQLKITLIDKKTSCLFGYTVVN